MLDLGFVVLLAAWSWGVGLWVLRRFGPLPEDPADAFGLAVPTGLGALGLAVLGLGEVGRLDPVAIRTVLGLGAWIALPGLLRQRVRPASGGRFPDRPGQVVLALVSLTLVGTLLTALAPVTDGDALCYHLQVPKLFLERGAVYFDPDLHETVYPLLTEMLYAVALAFRGPVACRLVHWLLGVTFALNVTALARPSLGRWSWWAGSVALLVPAVNNGMTAPLNDVALAAYGTAALLAWSRFRDRPTLRGAALTGVLTGLAMGVKYPALVLAGLIGLAVAPGLVSRVVFRVMVRGVGLSDRSRNVVARVVGRWTAHDPDGGVKPRRLVHLFAFLGAAWTVGGCWYVRALMHTGNPVHPFFRQVFGGSGLDEVLGAEKRPLPVDPWHLLTALGPLTLRPDTFDSFSHQLGPAFLLFLPALLCERPPRRVLGLSAIGYLFLTLCLTQRQSMRFVLTAVGPLSVAVAWLARSWWERGSWPGRALVAALLLVLTMESALAVVRARHGLGVVVGAETAEHFLERREPTYRVGRWVGENLAAGARIVGQDHRGFYFPRPYTMELAHRRRTGLGTRGESPGRIVARLRRAGFTHLLLCPPLPESAVEFDPALGRRLAPWLVEHEPVYREDLSDADGVVRRYAIYALADDRLASRGGLTR